MKLKHKKTLFIALYVLLFGMKINEQIKSEKISEIKELRQQDINFLKNDYLNALDNSHFNEQEREMLKDYFLPHLLQYQGDFGDEFIANILFSTENTYVNRNKNFNNSYLKASFSPLIGKIPYGELFAEGIISLAPNYSLEEFYHEYCHIIQSWNGQKNIYGEAFANFYSDGNYDDLYGLFTMLGILGDSKQLFHCLANGKMDDYWNLLQEKYPNVSSDIKALRENVELTFNFTYQQHIVYEGIQDPLRNLCISYLENIYQEKYHSSMKQDPIFQILTSMYLQEKEYYGENHPLLEDYIIYSDQGISKKIKLPK